MKELCSSAYQPQMVSIGPYHHGEQQLEAMEEHKHRALLTFLERSKKPLQCYVDALLPVVEDLKDAYPQLQPKWKQDTAAFLQLVIVDGCFVLEVMQAVTAKPEAFQKMGYADNDPIFSYKGKLSFHPFLELDILMLENQLPMLLLIKLFAAKDGSPDSLSKEDELIKLILKFLQDPHRKNNIQEFNPKSCLHILDLYRKSLLLPPIPPQASDGTYLDGTLSATQLVEAGIRIKVSKTRGLNDISFQGGVLKLPSLIVDDLSEAIFLNMMAFERCHFGAGDDVRSYFYFMSSIINNARDMSLLESCGVIQNGFGTPKAAANLFISLCRDVSVDNRRLEDVLKKMSRYRKKPLPRWMAYARHNYFTSVWSGLSLLAAIFLFALATIQTIYVVLDYYYEPKKKSPPKLV